MSAVRVIGAGYGPGDYRGLFPDPYALTLDDGLPTAVGIVACAPVAVITGAGVSTTSGIPDYRGVNSVPREPMTYQQFMADANHRSRYWVRNQIGWHHLDDAEPNQAHRVLARVGRMGKIQAIITQNIDRLHQRAGSFDVIDLHGRYDQVICTGCRTVMTRAVWGQILDDANPNVVLGGAGVGDIDFAPDADADVSYQGPYVVPDCPVCGAIVKPHVVFFGESADAVDVAHCAAVIDAAASVLVLGSSLTVYSARRFVRRAVKAGKPVVIVNHGQTRSDVDAAVKIDADVGDFLSAIEHSWIAGM